MRPTPFAFCPAWCLIVCPAIIFLLFFLAGHGGSVKDTSGDEADNKDETMVPVDYKESGQITDDEILKEVRYLIHVMPLLCCCCVYGLYIRSIIHVNWLC